jgi:hypothetical protein
MSTILDTMWHGRHVRVLGSTDAVFTLIIDGSVRTFGSRVDAIAAARELVRS